MMVTMWWRGVVVVIMLVVVAAGCRAGPGGGALATTPDTGTDAGADAGSATVVRIIDGDTLVVGLGDREERVRLIGIDTPETQKPDTPVECFGAEASAHLGELLPAGTAIRLERDTELRDKYDRLLAYAYRRADNLFVNLAMAQDGYAGQLSIPPNVTHAGDVGSAVSEARRNGRGLWASCSGPHQTTAAAG
jgi:micrococcal nuclease